MSNDDTSRDGAQHDEPGIEFENIAEDGEEPFIEMQVTLTEEGVRSIERGSGTSWSFEDADPPIDGLYVNSERELDREWLLGHDDDQDSTPSLRWDVIGALGTVMAGVMWMSAPLIDIYPMFVGGIVALLAGIYLIEQVDSGSDAAEVSC